VDEAAHHQGRIDADDRRDHDRVAHAVDVVREHGEEPGDADLLKLAQRRRQDLIFSPRLTRISRMADWPVRSIRCCEASRAAEIRRQRARKGTSGLMPVVAPLFHSQVQHGQEIGAVASVCT
jgi:hypothetical protein